MHAPRALPATRHQGQVLRRLSRIAMFVLLAMEAPRTLLDPPLAAVPFAQLAHIKLRLIVNAHHALPVKQPLKLEELLLMNALFVLLATLGLAALHVLKARISHQQAQVHAHLVLRERMVTQMV